MAIQQQPDPQTAYIPPLKCKCGGTAMLVRIAYQRKKSGTEELRMFQCYACREVTEVTFEN